MAVRLRYFYPRPPRGGRHEELARGGSRYRISIPALREEGDLQLDSTPLSVHGISIPALREEGDLQLDSTPLSVHGISIPALREEGDTGSNTGTNLTDAISIPALREEGDFGYQEAWAEYRIFLSPPSARRATF